MNKNYAASLKKLGLNPKNYEIKYEPDATSLLISFLKFAFNPPPSRRSRRSNSWDQQYLQRYMYYYSGKLTRSIFR